MDDDKKEMILHGATHYPDLYYEKLLKVATKALHQAYGGRNISGINFLLGNAPSSLVPRLAVWYRELGIAFDPMSLYRAVGVADPSSQDEVFRKARTLPLELPAPQDSPMESNKRWFDDLELAERGQSIRAYQGGRTSGK